MLIWHQEKPCLSTDEPSRTSVIWGLRALAVQSTKTFGSQRAIGKGWNSASRPRFFCLRRTKNAASIPAVVSAKGDRVCSAYRDHAHTLVMNCFHYGLMLIMFKVRWFTRSVQEASTSSIPFSSGRFHIERSLRCQHHFFNTQILNCQSYPRTELNPPAFGQYGLQVHRL